MNDLSRRGMLMGGALAAAAAGQAVARAPQRRKTPPASKLAGLEDSEQRRVVMPDGQAMTLQIAHPHPVEEDLPLMIRGRKPVPIYVMDGWDNFATVVGLVRMMQWGGSVPPCLVIGLGYEDPVAADKASRRRYDLTPNANGPITDVRYGGSAQYRSFIKTVVKPLIERSFIVDTAQSTLVGHSLGGLFALETALKEPTLFPNVLALSPSLWFDNHLVLQQWRAALKENAPFPRVVALAGDLEQTITRGDYNMTRNVEFIGEAVTAAKRSDQIFTGVLVDTSHHTIQGSGLTFGLRKLLDPTPPNSRAGLVNRV
jgi:predicted alpha/beta superfamily hydrolase